MSQDAAPNDIAKKRVVYHLPGMNDVCVRRDEFLAADGSAQTMDVYVPEESDRAGRLPAVIVVAGYPDEGFQRFVGCKFKDMGSSVSWAQLIARSGMTAITYTNREPIGDLHALMRHVRDHAAALRVDPAWIGIWASSGNVPLALSLLLKDSQEHVACAAFCYGYTMDLDSGTGVSDAAKMFKFANACRGRSVDDLRRDTPLFLARAGQDQMPGLNASLDRFVERALTSNLPITVTNHPNGPHAFDLVSDSQASRDVISQVLAFLRYHLLGS